MAEKEIENAFEVGTAMARQLFHSAEQQGCSLHVDVGRLESRDVLQLAAALHMTAAASPALTKPKLQPMATLARVGALPSIQLSSIGNEQSTDPLLGIVYLAAIAASPALKLAVLC